MCVSLCVCVRVCVRVCVCVCVCVCLSQDQLADYQIPRIEVSVGKKLRIVRYQLLQKVRPLLLNRESLFLRGQPISTSLAQKLLHNNYKNHSAFGFWDPVRVRTDTYAHTLTHTHTLVVTLIPTYCNLSH